jgi:predicted nucleic-acid-binding Zn-ribbon protein
MAEVSAEEFSRFFEQKKNSIYLCPVCGVYEFALNLYGDPNMPGGNMSQLALGPPQATHSFLSISCTNCGHSEFFHMTQFEKWRAAQKPAEHDQRPDGQKSGDQK